MARIISFFNNKGGVGKTTTTVNLASLMANDNKKVLVFGVDESGGCTAYLDDLSAADNDKYLGYGLYELIDEGIYNVAEYLKPTRNKNIDIIPHNSNLAQVEDLITQKAKSKRKNALVILKETLEKVTAFKDYDYILIDCSAQANSLIVQNAIHSSDYVIIPTFAEYFSVSNLKNAAALIMDINDKTDGETQLLGIVFCNTENNSLRDTFIEQVMESEFKDFLFENFIRKGIAIGKSAIVGRTCVEYSKTSNPACDYADLYEEIKERIDYYESYDEDDEDEE